MDMGAYSHNSVRSTVQSHLLRPATMPRRRGPRAEMVEIAHDMFAQLAQSCGVTQKRYAIAIHNPHCDCSQKRQGGSAAY
jgi:hypothetical protein